MQDIPIYDSLSNLGEDTNEDTSDPDTMTVDPLKELSDAEFEILTLYLKLVKGIQSISDNYKDATDVSAVLGSFQELKQQGEKQLWARMALKFGFNNIEQLLESNVKFRLRSGHFIEAYNE